MLLLSLLLAACDGAPPKSTDDTATDSAGDTAADSADSGCAAPITVYADADGDGYGDDATATSACEAGQGESAVGGDCAEGDPARNPGATETCNGVDDDCDDLTDDDDPPVDPASQTTSYTDGDDDGYGLEAVAACGVPLGNAEVGGDCDDADSGVNPDAVEVCDDLDADEDCSGYADDDDSGVDSSSQEAWYTDGDGDGYGDDARVTFRCDAPAGTAETGGDCDDADRSVHPGAAEVCDGADVDEDCDGTADDADASVDSASQSSWYTDGDGDGYGADGSATRACDAPAGSSAVAGDCDDAAAAVNPGAAEVCDGADADEDCDGRADDADSGAAGRVTVYADVDGDGYGTLTATVLCDPPAGYLGISGDCDDADGAISPAAAELCDAADVDEDCDGAADDADTGAAGGSTWYRDADGDGQGGTTTRTGCDAASGYVATSLDCDDSRSSVYVGAPEVCDTRDNDCDGATDEGLDVTWYQDADGDGYGNAAVTRAACSAPSGYVSDATDCNDTRSSVSPRGTEVCDAADVDEDCDGLADDADASVTGTTTAWLDTDGDGYGATSRAACTHGAGYVATGGDCDEADVAVNPGVEEVCEDAVDNNCDGTVDEHCRPLWSGEYTVADADTRYYGNESGDAFGFTVEAADFDADGYADLAVGAPEDELNTSYSGYGSVYVFRGPLEAGSWMGDDATDSFLYSTSSSYRDFGDKMWALPDWDGDGLPELAVGTRDNGTYWDVNLYWGRGVFEGASDYTNVLDCSSMSGAADFLTGYPRALACGFVDTTVDDGLVYFYPTRSSTAAATLVAESSEDVAGTDVHAEDDLDGDGVADALVGAPGDDDAGDGAGAAYIVWGPISGSYRLAAADAKILGAAAQDQLGTQVAACDVDEDGIADPVVAAYRYDHDSKSSTGAVYIFSGAPSGVTYASDASQVVYGGAAADSIGGYGMGMGDVDGDGSIDILVSSPSDDTYDVGAGGAWLVYGPLSGAYDLATDVDAHWTGDERGEDVGRDSLLADFNGDGVADVALGGYAADEGSVSSVGAAWVFLGGW